MPKEFEQVYVGDGVYARWDGMAVLLETERDNGRHYIYLEAQHVENIRKLIEDYPDGRFQSIASRAKKRLSSHSKGER